MRWSCPGLEPARFRTCVRFTEPVWNRELPARSAEVRLLRDPGGKLETAKADRGTVSILAIPTIIALWFVNSSAFTYLTVGPESFGIFRPRHDWLYAHIVAGIVALLFGPVQLWLGANHRTAFIHRILGVLY